MWNRVSEVLRFHCGPCGTHKKSFLQELMLFLYISAYTDSFELDWGLTQYCNQQLNALFQRLSYKIGVFYTYIYMLSGLSDSQDLVLVIRLYVFMKNASFFYWLHDVILTMTVNYTWLIDSPNHFFFYHLNFPF